jgi:cytochrome oxidase Cu insertion factor (SCO1/SenC/PrrC family)
VTHTRLVLGLALGLGLSVAPLQAQEPAEPTAAELMDAVMWGRDVGGPFALVDHTGQRRTDADFRGKLLLIYFGYSYCPDVCPTDLSAIGLALDRLGPAGDAIQPLFITIDPERDTLEHLADYVPLFHPRLIGLGGDANAIRQAARAYKVYYKKVATSDGQDYAIDHGGFIYLVGADGRYVGFFPPGTSPERMAATLRTELARMH